MHIAGLNHLPDVLGRFIIFLSSNASAGLSPAGTSFVSSHDLVVPMADFSAGQAYDGDFLEISTQWYQSALGDDYHQLSISRTSTPASAGKRIAQPDWQQYPFEGFPNFHGIYFDKPVTRIEVLESTVTTAEVGGGSVEQIVYDSHIRLVAGTREVVLTTEHGTIHGEIEIYAGRADGTVSARGMEAAHLRLSMDL